MCNHPKTMNPLSSHHTAPVMKMRQFKNVNLFFLSIVQNPIENCKRTTHNDIIWWRRKWRNAAVNNFFAGVLWRRNIPPSPPPHTNSFFFRPLQVYNNNNNKKKLKRKEAGTGRGPAILLQSTFSLVMHNTHDYY